MPLVPYVDTKALPPEYQTLVARGTGTQRTIMHSLEGGRAYLEFGNWIRFKTRIDPRLREMVILQVAYVVRNEYELGHHVKLAKDFGVADSDMRAIVDETAGRPGGLSATDTLALRATRELLQARRLSDETAAELTRSFNSEIVVELVLIVGFYSFADIFLSGMRVEMEEEYRPYLARMPFPAA